jgi:hypothetical protein
MNRNGYDRKFLCILKHMFSAWPAFTKQYDFVVFYFGFYATISEFRVARTDVNNE